MRVPARWTEPRHWKERKCPLLLLQTAGSTPDGSLCKTRISPVEISSMGKGETAQKRDIQGTRSKPTQPLGYGGPAADYWGLCPARLQSSCPVAGTATHVDLHRRTSHKTQDRHTRGPDSTSEKNPVRYTNSKRKGLEEQGCLFLYLFFFHIHDFSLFLFYSLLACSLVFFSLCSSLILLVICLLVFSFFLFWSFLLFLLQFGFVFMFSVQPCSVLSCSVSTSITAGAVWSGLSFTVSKPFSLTKNQTKTSKAQIQ